jgi:uncharacterized membrane protein
MDPNPSSGLEAQVRELTSRVYRLEKALEDHGISPATQPGPGDPRVVEQIASESAILLPTPPLSHAAEHPFDQPAAYPPTAPLQFAIPAMAALKDERTLENRIGSQWFNRIGILAMLIGMAWFLKLAIDNHWVGPLGRVLIGLLAGGGLIAWSERFQKRGYAAFSYSLKAVGSGILYLSLWAAFSLYHLIPSGVAFGAMIAVTVFNGFLSWVQDAELLALYAIAGALSTPLLLSTGENREIALLTYLLMLNLAVLILVILRPWSRLLFAAFAGSTVFFAGWWAEFYSDSQRAITAVFLTSFFLLFAFSPRLVRVELKDDEPPSLWNNLALVVLPIANACLGFLGYYALYDSMNHEWAGACVAVVLAAFYLLLIRLPHRGLMRPCTALVSSLYLTVAIVFLTIAIPLKAHGRWLTIGWLVEGAALFWLGGMQRSRLLRVLALLCLAMGLTALIAVDASASTTPIFNTRFGTYLVAIAVFAFVGWTGWKGLSGLSGWTAQHAYAEDSPQEDEFWRSIAPASVLIVNGLILLSLSLEIHHYWWSLRWRGDYNHLAYYQMYAQFTYSALFMIFGAILLTIGFWRRSAFVRWQALVLLAAAIAKVFLADVSQLSQGYRILSFIGLGALLLAVSFVYQRDWLHLRELANSQERPH